MVSFKGADFVPDMILTCVRWYLAYPLSSRQVEELRQERDVFVDHATINRWVLKYSPPLEEAFHRRKHPVGNSWRMDETYIRVKGEWRYLYRAVGRFICCVLGLGHVSLDTRHVYAEIGFEMKAKALALCDSMFILDGLLEHQTQLRPVRSWRIRVAGSLHQGTLSASEMIRSLLWSNRPSTLPRAIGALGGIAMTLYMLAQVDDES